MANAQKIMQYISFNLEVNTICEHATTILSQNIVPDYFSLKIDTKQNKQFHNIQHIYTAFNTELMFENLY